MQQQQKQHQQQQWQPQKQLLYQRVEGEKKNAESGGNECINTVDSLQFVATEYGETLSISELSDRFGGGGGNAVISPHDACTSC